MKRLLSQQSFQRWTTEKRESGRLPTAGPPPPRCRSSMLPSVRDAASPDPAGRAGSRLATAGGLSLGTLGITRPMTSLRHNKTFSDWFREKEMQKRQRTDELRRLQRDDQVSKVSDRRQKRNDAYTRMQLESQWVGHRQRK